VNGKKRKELYSLELTEAGIEDVQIPKSLQNPHSPEAKQKMDALPDSWEGAGISSRAYGVPDFILVGAAKAGTTSLYWALHAHPQIYMSRNKEPNFFSKPPSHPNGPQDEISCRSYIRTIDAYLDLFKDKKNNQICGEASPSYLYFTESAKQIKDCNDRAKIIIILRNPVERAYSNYMHMRRDGREYCSFISAIEMEQKREKSGWEWSWMYKKCGLYYESVKKYLDTFDEPNVNIILYDDFVIEPTRCIKNIYNFLGVDPLFIPTVRKFNVTGEPRSKWIQTLITYDSNIKTRLKKYIPPLIRFRIREGLTRLNLKKIEMDSSAKKQLIKYYTEDIERLAKLIRKDLSFWIKMD
jgi:hypothetical protein